MWWGRRSSAWRCMQLHSAAAAPRLLLLAIVAGAVGTSAGRDDVGVQSQEAAHAGQGLGLLRVHHALLREGGVPTRHASAGTNTSRAARHASVLPATRCSGHRKTGTHAQLGPSCRPAAPLPGTQAHSLTGMSTCCRESWNSLCTCLLRSLYSTATWPGASSCCQPSSSKHASRCAYVGSASRRCHSSTRLHLT